MPRAATFLIWQLAHLRQVREDDAHLLGKALARNATLERLLVDKTALSVQHLLSGERLVCS